MVAVLPPARHQIPDHWAYHGAITGNIAEKKLRAQRGACYLFRYSEAKKHHLVSVKSRDNQVHHVKLEIYAKKDSQSRLYRLGGSDKSFKSLNELIKYYRKNTLSPYIRSLGEPCLCTENYYCCYL